MAEPKIKVLCIVGWCRNGSTIIGNILNEADSLFHAGELHFLWKNAIGNGANSWCGCGSALTDCALWSRVLADSGASGHDMAALVSRQHRTVRTRHTWRNLKRGISGRDTAEQAQMMAATYRAIVRATGCQLIIDGSKMPGEAALLAHMDEIEPYYLHLVRDPRAIAQSWHNPKDYIHSMSALRSTGYWVGFNLAARALTKRYPERSMTLRYEDFIAAPHTTLDRLLTLCGIDPSANPITDRTVDLTPNHTVTGNPDRFRSGTTVIRAHDDGWRGTLPPGAKAMATLLSWPWLHHYGYSWGCAPLRQGKETRLGSGA